MLPVSTTLSAHREVLLLARWMAADLYLRDLDKLAADLSMQHASAGSSKLATVKRTCSQTRPDS